MKVKLLKEKINELLCLDNILKEKKKKLEKKTSEAIENDELNLESIMSADNGWTIIKKMNRNKNLVSILNKLIKKYFEQNILANEKLRFFLFDNSQTHEEDTISLLILKKEYFNHSLYQDFINSYKNSMVKNLNIKFTFRESGSADNIIIFNENDIYYSYDHNNFKKLKENKTTTTELFEIDEVKSIIKKEKMNEEEALKILKLNK